MKRLAIQGHDHERELEYFASEIKSQRFVTDFPLTWRIWSGKACAGVARYWFGWAYQIVSGFGRSLARPFLFWLATIAIAALYVLGQSPAVASRHGHDLTSYAHATFAAWRGNEPCYEGLRDQSGNPDPRLTGLVEPVRRQTSAATEALHLALRNAFIFLDGGGDALHRTFGCLYGLERYSDNLVPIVPSNVSFASALQKAVSGVLIFLFGLGVRNMLRMK